MTRKERMQERNALVRKQFYELLAKNPKWRIDAIVDEVEKLLKAHLPSSQGEETQNL